MKKIVEYNRKRGKGMKWFNAINPIDVLFWLLFIVPIVFGMNRGFSVRTLVYSIQSCFDTIELMLSIYISIVITRKTFFDRGTFLHDELYSRFPDIIKNAFTGRDFLVYVVFVPILLFIFVLILKFLFQPFYEWFVKLVNSKLYFKIEAMNNLKRSLLGGVWNIPKSVLLLLVVSGLLSMCSYFFPTTEFFEYQSKSKFYNIVYNTGVNPVLNSNIAKSIPVIIKRSFAGEEYGFFSELQNYKKDKNNKPKQSIWIVKYYNGVRLSEAIKITPEVEGLAREITKGEKTQRGKAEKIYNWITENMSYDYEKAKKLSVGGENVSSGAMSAMQSKKGICFDFSSLFIAMCKANNIKVNLVTGMAFSGISWGDHAWNQFYDSSQNRWVNIDTTFGLVNNYFDKPDFDVDHKYAEIQKTW